MEPKLSSIREEDGVEGEEELELFYEEIEAPKFVDLTLPDPFRKGDDRYWFCQRVGCDQMHEEEMDPEEIYRNFVLRIMAARSPNLKLRRALNKRAISDSKKCPASAPPKPSQSRILRLAAVPVFPHKKTKSQETVQPASKAISTPKARVRHVAAKYMTTPRGRRCSGNPKPFQSVRNPEKKSIMHKNDKVVAKALVFNSPQKSGKAKASEECYTPITRLCKKMKKLEITSEKKSHAHKVSKTMVINDTKLSSDVATTKVIKSHKVKIQKAYSVNHDDNEKHEANTCVNSNGGTEVDDLRQNELMHQGETADRLFSKTARNGSHENCLPSMLRPQGDEKIVDEEEPTMSEALRNSTSRDSQEEATSSTDCPPKCEDYSARSSADGERQLDPSINSEEKAPPAGTVSDSHGIVVKEQSFGEAEDVNDVKSDSSKEERPLDHCSQGDQSSREGHERECVDISGKENARTTKAIRDFNNIRHEKRKDTSSKHDKARRAKVLETTGTIMKENDSSGTIMKENDSSGTIMKENDSSGVCNQASTHKKLKVTNPRPFRLRTDERGILKEAILEKKHNLYEGRTASDLSSERSQKDHWNSTTQVNSDLNAYGRSGHNTQKGIKKDQEQRFTEVKILQTRTMQHKDPKQEAETKSGTVKLNEQMISAQPKPIPVLSELKQKKEGDMVHDLEEKSTTTGSSLLQKKPVVRPPRRRGSAKATGGRLSHCESNPAEEAYIGHRLASKVRRPTTIQKEPNFHSIHLTKTCTRAALAR
ncbi:hypothetical protein Droror1_Dr00007008 [Drosera rotundifolia]